MIYFENYFKDTDFTDTNTSDEVAVRCPFPHSTVDGKAYYESVPSAHINVEKSVFHCKVCGENSSEVAFMATKTGLTYSQAVKLLSTLENNTIRTNWRNAQVLLNTTESALQLLTRLRIKDNVKTSLRLGFEGNGISFPVFVYGTLVDVRKYVPDGRPKVKSRTGAKAGYFIPDVARVVDAPTIYMCAGEKDMAIARSYGLEAYTITGGEGKIPSEFGYAFRNKRVYIIYDNDKAGRQGGQKLGRFVKEHGGIPHVVLGHHKVATEKGEDLFDYLVKYGQSKEQLLAMLEATPEMSTEEIKNEMNKEYPLLNLDKALEPQFRNKYVSSTVQVTATYGNTFGIPSVIEVEKYFVEGSKSASNLIAVGTKFMYTIDEDNISDILYLMDSNLKEEQVFKNIRTLCKIPVKEVGIKIVTRSHETVYKASIVNNNLTGDNGKPLELDIYSFVPLENGKKYRIFYKVVQHPLRQQELILIAKRVQPIDSDLEEFVVTPTIREQLAVFQLREGMTVKKGMERLFEYDKGYLGAEANENIVQTVDLVYNTPLSIKVGKTEIKGALDVFMVGETRTGKSKTSKIKRDMYDLGTVINLGTSTKAGLIGGTNKSTNRTKIGLLPREHKNLVILEEFSSMNDPSFLKSLTDIRSSYEVRLVRVDTEIRVPCKLRMLTISNPKSRMGGAGRSLKSYPNGIEVLLELIDSAEDIARYDFFTLVPEPANYVSFMDIDYEKLPLESYRSRIRWIWTRKPEDIDMSVDVQKYLWQRSVEINKMFNTHVKIFGTEAWQKMARVAVACAGMLVSTDTTGTKIKVEKGHIDWAFDFFMRIYDNDIFKLRQFVTEQRRYTHVDTDLVTELQDLYYANSTMLNFLEMTSGVTRATLRDVSGKDNTDFSIVLNDMARLYLFKWSGNSLIPSERFRRGMAKINRNVTAKRGSIRV